MRNILLVIALIATPLLLANSCGSAPTIPPPPYGSPETPDFVINAVYGATGLVAVGTARLADISMSRTAAHIQAAMNIYHLLDTFAWDIEEIPAGYGGGTEGDPPALFFSARNEVIMAADMGAMLEVFPTAEEGIIAVSVLRAILNTAYVAADGYADGNYWAVLALHERDAAEIAYAAWLAYMALSFDRAAVSGRNLDENLPDFVRDATKNIPDGAFVGIGRARGADISRARRLARNRAITDISRQLNSVVTTIVAGNAQARLTVSQSRIERATIIAEGIIEGEYWVVVMIPGNSAMGAMEHTERGVMGNSLVPLETMGYDIESAMLWARLLD